MFDHLLESSQQDDSNKWSNIGLDEEITQVNCRSFYVPYLVLCKFLQHCLKEINGCCETKNDVNFYILELSHHENIQ